MVSETTFALRGSFERTSQQELLETTEASYDFLMTDYLRAECREGSRAFLASYWKSTILCLSKQIFPRRKAPRQKLFSCHSRQRDSPANNLSNYLWNSLMRERLFYVGTIVQSTKSLRFEWLDELTLLGNPVCSRDNRKWSRRNERSKSCGRLFTPAFRGRFR